MFDILSLNNCGCAKLPLVAPLNDPDPAAGKLPVALSTLRTPFESK